MKAIAVFALAVFVHLYLGSCSFALATTEAVRNEYTDQFIVEHLNLNSFLCSIMLRQQPGKSTFADYGYRVIDNSGGIMTLKTDAVSSTFEIKVLNQNRNGINIFLQERLQHGSLYTLQSILHLTPDFQGGLIAERTTWSVLQKADAPSKSATRNLLQK